MRRIFLVRHGETQYAVERRLSGLAAVSLTQRGRAQAAALATQLTAAGCKPAQARLLSSPIVRARETASIIGDALQVVVETDERLRERDFGDWDGKTGTEIKARWPELVAKWRHDPAATCPPNGETAMALIERVTDFWGHEVSRAAGDGDLIVVSHSSPLQALLCLALGVPVAVAPRIHLHIGGMSQVRLTDGGEAEVRYVNAYAHLGDDVSDADRDLPR